MCVQLLPDDSQSSVAVQKQILKIYFALTQFVLPLDLITRDMFAQWMEVLRTITEKDVPAHTLQVGRSSPHDVVRVADPDWIRIQSGSGSRSRRAKMTHKSRKELRNFMF
jgi:hypothetical protein